MIGDHNSQYQPGSSAITRTSGCTWTVGATGIAVVTGGGYTPTPDKIHGLVARSEETSPSTPGWSLDDLKLALSRFGMSFTIATGEGWAAVEQAVDERRFVVIQGDSDQFGNDTCSGAFDGPHCIGIDGSKRKVEDGVEYWWIHDPICPTGRWERKGVVRRYAEKLLSTVFFGWFNQRVPSPKGWTWRYDPAGRGSFAIFTVAGGRITGVERVSTRATATYRCTPRPPDPTPWPGHKPVYLVTLGNLANGQKGPHTGDVVNAKYAKEQ